MLRIKIGYIIVIVIMTLGLTFWKTRFYNLDNDVSSEHRERLETKRDVIQTRNSNLQKLHFQSRSDNHSSKTIYKLKYIDEPSLPSEFEIPDQLQYLAEGPVDYGVEIDDEQLWTEEEQNWLINNSDDTLPDENIIPVELDLLANELTEDGHRTGSYLPRP
jgi:hypothetical protein